MGSLTVDSLTNVSLGKPFKALANNPPDSVLAVSLGVVVVVVVSPARGGGGKVLLENAGAGSGTAVIDV